MTPAGWSIAIQCPACPQRRTAHRIAGLDPDMAVVAMALCERCGENGVVTYYAADGEVVAAP